MLVPLLFLFELFHCNNRLHAWVSYSLLWSYVLCLHMDITQIKGSEKWLCTCVAFTHLSSVHCRSRCWALGEWKENLSMVRKCCFSGDSRRRSCSSSCSYMSLCRSRADRFSSSCCCSRLCIIDCIGSRKTTRKDMEGEDAHALKCGVIKSSSFNNQ